MEEERRNVIEIKVKLLAHKNFPAPFINEGQGMS